PQVNNRRGIERQQLAYEQSADDRDSQWVPQLRASASPQRQWQSAQQRRHRGHHDGPETQQARLIYRFFRRFMLDSFGLQRKIDHHDGILLHDSNQKDDADQRHHSQIIASD